MFFLLPNKILICFFVLFCHFDKLLLKKKVVFAPRISCACLCVAFFAPSFTRFTAPITPLPPYGLLNISASAGSLCIFVYFIFKGHFTFPYSVTSFPFPWDDYPALLHFRIPPIVIDDSSLKNAVESFTVALIPTPGGYKSAIAPIILACQTVAPFNFFLSSIFVKIL